MNRSTDPPSDGDRLHAAPADEDLEDAARTYTRREALAAVRKYSAVVAGSATVILSADDVLAQAACSRIFRNGNGPPPGKGPPRCRS